MITYRKTKTGAWVAYGPAVAVQPNRDVTVTKSNGSTKVEHIDTVGKPFVVDGIQMRYGYLTASAKPASSTTARSAVRTSHMCDECGERRATTTALDMSGIPGRVCGRCAADGDLSFA